MRRLTWQGPGVLNEGGKLIDAGGELEVTDERAVELLAQALPIVEAGQSPLDLAGTKRPKLDELARQAGVTAPEKLPNKQAVIAAIEAAEAEPAAAAAADVPEAEGEGQQQPQTDGPDAGPNPDTNHEEA